MAGHYEDVTAAVPIPLPDARPTFDVLYEEHVDGVWRLLQRFGVPEELPQPIARLIKQADRIAAFFEATRLAGFSLEEGCLFFDQPPELPPGLEKLLYRLIADPAHIAQRTFLAHFEVLRLTA